MRIATIEASLRRVPLTRPYTIALKVTTAVDMLLLRITADDGTVGLGSASPEPQITGETLAMCRAALQPTELRWLIGEDVAQFAALASRARELHRAAPGACAALDMALHDLRAKQLGVPVADLLGRVHDELPTSITIGIKPLRETLEEADEYLGRGFRCLKVKIGKSLTEDIARVVRLRDLVGPDIALRVDANQGYRPAELLRFLHDTAGLGIELVEQPLPPNGDDALRLLPADLTARLAADESVMDERDAARLAQDPRPFGTFVIKLMKCGGIAPALQIAAVAERAGIDLMWGCMDESVIGISAALHAAFACARTRYLDLDGSFDLAQDFANGGFELRNGVLRTLDRPGLGVALQG